MDRDSFFPFSVLLLAWALDHNQRDSLAMLDHALAALAWMASHEGERFLLGDVEVRPEGLSFFGFSIPWQTLRITQPELLAKLRDAVKNGSLEEVLDALSNLKIRSQKDPHTWLLWTLGKLN